MSYLALVTPGMRLANGAFSPLRLDAELLGDRGEQVDLAADDLVALGELVRRVAGVGADLDLAGAADLLGQLRVEIGVGTDRGRRRRRGVAAAERAGATGGQEQRRDGRGDESELGGDAHEVVTSRCRRREELSHRLGCTRFSGILPRRTHIPASADDLEPDRNVVVVTPCSLRAGDPVVVTRCSAARRLALTSLVTSRRKSVVCSLLGPDRAGRFATRPLATGSGVSVARDGSRRSAFGWNHSRAVRSATVREGM